MTLSDLQGHAPNSGFLKCDFSYSCAAERFRLTYSMSRGPSAIAERLAISSANDKDFHCHHLQTAPPF